MLLAAAQSIQNQIYVFGSWVHAERQSSAAVTQTSNLTEKAIQTKLLWGGFSKETCKCYAEEMGF